MWTTAVLAGPSFSLGLPACLASAAALQVQLTSFGAQPATLQLLVNSSAGGTWALQDGCSGASSSCMVSLNAALQQTALDISLPGSGSLVSPGTAFPERALSCRPASFRQSCIA